MTDQPNTAVERLAKLANVYERKTEEAFLETLREEFAQRRDDLRTLLASHAALVEAVSMTLTAWAAAKAGDIASADWMNAAEEKARTALNSARGG